MVAFLLVIAIAVLLARVVNLELKNKELQSRSDDEFDDGWNELEEKFIRMGARTHAALEGRYPLVNPKNPFVDDTNEKILKNIDDEKISEALEDTKENRRVHYKTTAEEEAEKIIQNIATQNMQEAK